MTRILIVEDEEPVRSMLHQLFKMYGYECIVAADATEGREYLQKSDFDLILSDLNMPGESGLQFLQHALAEKPGLRTILYTGYDHPEVEERALEIGVSDYLTKPFSLHTLLARVAEVLKRQ